MWIYRFSWSFAFFKASIDVSLSSSNFFKDNVSTFVNDLEGWHGLDTILCSNFSILVNVDLDQVNALLFAFRYDVRSNSFAGSAPGGVEVDQALISFLEELIELLGSVGVVWHILLNFNEISWSGRVYNKLICSFLIRQFQSSNSFIF